MIDSVIHNDLPREELLRRADQAIKQFTQPGVKATVRFKFTCERCGTRCTLSEPNVLYENGECYECGHTTVITKGGFMMEMSIGGDS
jgi:hypothetical protein